MHDLVVPESNAGLGIGSSSNNIEFKMTFSVDLLPKNV